MVPGVFELDANRALAAVNGNIPPVRKVA
jgi:hypothetical protein